MGDSVEHVLIPSGVHRGHGDCLADPDPEVRRNGGRENAGVQQGCYFAEYMRWT